MSDLLLGSVHLINEYDHYEVPKGTSYVTFEVDSSACYYAGEQPEYIIHFWQEKE